MAVVSHEAIASSEAEAATAPTLVGSMVAPQAKITSYYSSAEISTTTTTNNVHNTDSDDAESNSNDDEGEESFWEMLVTWYLPLVLLWLRRSMFGTANLVRSLLVGQVLRLLLLTQSGEMPKWAQPFTDPHAWPPPAFTALAIFTVVAFVVHPDGLTWFMLGKLRDAILSLLHSFATCWTMFIQDYGIITTTIALMTLAGIGCLLGILLKNALPSKGSTKRNYSSSQAAAAVAAENKKKKKRKGVKGKGSRIRQFRKQASQEGTTERVPDVKPIDDESSSATHVQESTRIFETRAILEEEVTSQEELDTTITPSSSEILMEESIPESTPLAPTTTAERPRMQSTDTVETMTDDLSCDSISVRSFASTPTTVTIGSTGTSEKSTLHPKRRTASSRRKQREQNNGSSKLSRGDRKVAPHIDGTHETKMSSRRQNSVNKSVNRHHQDGASRHSVQTQKAAPTGRFANLKEKDTRFDNPRTRNNQSNVIRTGGGSNKGRNNNVHHGRNNNRNPLTQQQNHQASDSYFAPAPVQSLPVKNVHEAPISRTLQRPAPSNNQYFGSSNQEQFGSSNQEQFGSSVQFGSPHLPDTNNQKKQDLASFVATVGLVGNDANSLVTNVADIDALDRLSDIQFQLYGVSADKQSQLGKLLEERRRRRRSAVRPPPGLSPIHDEPPTLFGSPNRHIAPQYSSSLNQTTTQQYASCMNQTPVFPAASTTHPFAYDEYQQPFLINDEDSRIEAELQELGGKMIGSVLDF